MEKKKGLNKATLPVQMIIFGTLKLEFIFVKYSRHWRKKVRQRKQTTKDSFLMCWFGHVLIVLSMISFWCRILFIFVFVACSICIFFCADCLFTHLYCRYSRLGRNSVFFSYFLFPLRLNPAKSKPLPPIGHNT